MPEPGKYLEAVRELEFAMRAREVPGTIDCARMGSRLFLICMALAIYTCVRSRMASERMPPADNRPRAPEPFRNHRLRRKPGS
jgi:hypothetical protein